MSTDTIKMICDEGMLQFHTANGWQLHSVLEEDHVIQLRRELEEPKDTQSGYYFSQQNGFSGRPTVVTEVLAKRHRYLLLKSVDTRVGELETNNSKLLGSLQDLERRHEEMIRLGAEAKDIAEQRKQTILEHGEQLRLLREELRTANTTKGRMEADLAAVRKDIGESAFKRILEG